MWKEMAVLFWRGLRVAGKPVGETLLGSAALLLLVAIVTGPVVLAAEGSAWWLALYVIHAIIGLLLAGASVEEE